MRKVKIPKTQIFCFILIMIVCIIAIVEALYYVMNGDIKENENVGDNNTNDIAISETNLVENFDDLFQNTFENTNTSENAEKITVDKDYVYTEYEKQEINSGNYEIDVNIPTININSEEV